MSSNNPSSPILAPSDLELEPKEVEILAYIHSNKFITPKLYHRKFHSHQTYVTACSHLRAMEARGLVLRVRKFQNDDTYYYLTRPSIRHLSGLARILTSPEIRSPHINPFEREHDKRVLAMRVQIEQTGGFQGLTWLSDYEMRCGLRMGWKKALEVGKGWDLAGTKLHRVHRRTPDGYFQGTLQDQAYGFVLEYEHSAYNREKISKMILNLTYDFPNAFRLIVSRDIPHTVRMMHAMDTYLKGHQDRGLWGFSFFEKVNEVPFIRVPWANLDGGYLPFVKDPIRKVVTPGLPEEAKPEGMTA